LLDLPACQARSNEITLFCAESLEISPADSITKAAIVSFVPVAATALRVMRIGHPSFLAITRNYLDKAAPTAKIKSHPIDSLSNQFCFPNRLIRYLVRCTGTVREPKIEAKITTALNIDDL